MFKKKDALVKDGAKEEAANKKAAKKVAKKAKSGKSIFSWVYQPALVVIICAGLAYVLIDQLSITQNEQSINASTNKQRLDSATKSLDAYVSSKRQGLKNLASKTPGEREVDVEVLKQVWPELSAFYQIPGLGLDNARQTYPELSFASVDLLRRALKEKRVIVEPFFSDVWRLQVAAPDTRNDASAGAGHIALGIFELNELNLILKQSEAASKGKLALLSSSGKEIVSVGSGSKDLEIKGKTSVSGLSLSYAANAQTIVAIDRVMILMILLGAALVAAIIIVVISRLQMASIRKDIRQVGQLASKLASGTKKVGNFTYGEFTVVSQVIADQIKQLTESAKKAAEAQAAKTTAAAAKSGAPAAAPEDAEDDAPLFDDELLDLDVLNEHDESETLGASDDMVSESQGLDIDVPQNIFRAYDIRGVVNETLNEGIAELIGKAIASEALLLGQKALCVGCDGRHSSGPYSEALIKGILSTGLDVIAVGQVPTPVLYFSTHHFKTGSGVMVTGSHNPANYNGFKIMLDGKALSGEEIQKLYNRILLQDFEAGQGSLTECDVSQEYMDTILNDIAVAAPLKVVLDAGNGVAGNIAPQLIEELGCEVIPLYCDIDGNFPNHHPDPSNPDNLSDLIAAVQEHDADIGLAFDGDADRLGVVTNTGKIIWPDRLLMLFAKDVVSRNPGADILFDVKCSRRLNGLISSYGGRPVMWKSGHSFMKAKMKETGALLAGEMSGHIFFKERWFGFDDGLYSAARLLEVLGIEDRTSEEVFADFPEDVSTPEIYLDVTDESKFRIVESLCALKDEFVGGNASTIDGLRVEYPNGWGLCRASNTTPALALRFEADDESAMEEIKAEFRAQLQAVDPSIQCNF